MSYISNALIGKTNPLVLSLMKKHCKHGKNCEKTEPRVILLRVNERKLASSIAYAPRVADHKTPYLLHETFYLRALHQ